MSTNFLHMKQPRFHAISQLEQLGRKLVIHRGERGIREVAKEIGVSPATLSRVERGLMPDVDTFTKICNWLNVDPGEVLGTKPHTISAPIAAAVHFRKDQAVAPETAQALAQLILAVHTSGNEGAFA
jgi:transcriptional regulator with XRE-family HTH domain